MNLFGVLDINASALTAERERAEVVASNMANAETTSTPGGGPYKKQLVVFGTERPGTGQVCANLVALRRSARAGSKSGEGGRRTRLRPCAGTNPAIPDADADGYVSFPTSIPRKRWST